MSTTAQRAQAVADWQAYHDLDDERIDSKNMYYISVVSYIRGSHNFITNDYQQRHLLSFRLVSPYVHEDLASRANEWRTLAAR